jgi:hypothetical protein
MGTGTLKLPVWLWVVIVLFVIVLWTDHVNALWVASLVWHAAVDVITGINRGLTALRTRPGG